MVAPAALLIPSAPMQMGTRPNVDIGGWISAGWNLFTPHWGTWVKMALLVMLPLFPGIIGYIYGYVSMISMMMPQPGAYGPYGQPPEPPFFALGVFGVSVVLVFIGSFVSIYFQIGMWKAALKTARGGVPSLSDMKGNGHLYLKVLGGSIVVGLLTMLGVFACYIGAFVVMGWYLFVVPLLIDKDLPIGEALRQSKDMTTGQLLMYILFAFVTGIVSQLGAYFCLVGIVVTLPLHYLIFGHAYTRCFDAPATAPATAGPAFPPAPAPGAWPPPTT